MLRIRGAENEGMAMGRGVKYLSLTDESNSNEVRERVREIQ